MVFSAVYVAGGFDTDKGIINGVTLPSHHPYVLSTLQRTYPGRVYVEGVIQLKEAFKCRPAVATKH